MMEEITPHGVTLLILLQEYCRGLSEDPEFTRKNTSASNEPWNAELRHAISKILVRDSQDSTRTAQNSKATLSSLVEELRNIKNEGTELASLILEAVMQIESPEEILEHTDALRELINPSHGGKSVLDSNGMLGLYIRRVLLTFDQMDFSQTSKLYRQMQLYKRQSMNVTLRGNMSFAVHDDDDDDSLPSVLGAARVPLISSRQAVRVFNRARELAAQGLSADDFLAKLGTPLESMVHLPIVHYVKYLQCVQSKDLNGALENLHRYFDLQAVHTSQKSSSQQKFFFHYATLSLAGLHNTFGNSKEALDFVLETVKIAQENMDHRCLQHSLGWLSRLEEGKPALQLAQLFVQNTKSDESKEGRYLYSLAQLTYAKKLFSEGEHSTKVLEAVSIGYSTSVLGSEDELIGMSYMLHSGLFDMYGHRNLAMLYSQMHLRNRSPGAAEDGCEAYSKIASHFFEMGERDLAYEILAEAEPLFPAGTPTGELLVALRLQFDHQVALYDRDWETAIAIGNKLLEYGKHDATKADGIFRGALYCREIGRYELAADILTKLSSKLFENSKPVLPLARVKEVRIKLLYAEILLETNNASAAACVAEEALTLSKTMSLLIAQSKGQLLLAEIKLAQKDLDACKLMLHKATPRLLAHGSLEDRGRVHLVTGKLSVIAASASSEQSPLLMSALNSFIKSKEAFAKLRAKRLEQRSLNCLARIYDTLGNTEERDKCAAAFHLLE